MATDKRVASMRNTVPSKMHGLTDVEVGFIADILDRNLISLTGRAGTELSFLEVLLDEAHWLGYELVRRATSGSTADTVGDVTNKQGSPRVQGETTRGG